MPRKQKKTEWPRTSHFIGAESCRFGKSTLVGKYVVSSVGEYAPRDHGGCGFEPIGCNRLYETMVFKTTGRFCRTKGCPCGGIPDIIPRELDFAAANTREECLANHKRIVAKWRRKRAKANA